MVSEWSCETEWQQNSYKATDHIYNTPDCTNINNTEMMECVAYGVVKK